MNNRSELNRYITRLQQRLRAGVWLRGAAIFTATALAITVALVLLLNRFAFPAHGVTAGRLTIFVALALAAVVGIVLPVIGVTRKWAVGKAEAANPGLEQRLTTFEEQVRKSNDPFLELLAADTLAHTKQTEPHSLVPDNRLFALGGAGVACLAVLVWMIAYGPGYLGYGAAMLWTDSSAAPLYAIRVTPGNVTVRRNSDQLITAHVTGMRPDQARLFAHYASASGWEPVAMQDEHDTGGGATYQFVFAGLPETVEYYVAAGPLVSTHYKLRVLDLPSVKQIKVTYHYPAWTGMKPVTEEQSGDLRAIEGTEAAIEVEMDRPLKNGRLTLDNGQMIQLAGSEGNRYRGAIRLEKDGAYHLADLDGGQEVRLSEDYFIATDKAMPPEISIDRPAGDYRASPIEEVTVGVTARDQFGLHDVRLHYSVNGGPTQDANLLESAGTKSANGSYLLPLEEFKLVPGDLVSLYATARDGHSEARTDISFVQVEPFEREFSQSQQIEGNGGGSGGNNQMEISRRQKELIAATWKQQNDKMSSPKEASAAGQFLSDAQRKLRDQVMALSVRMQSRDLSQANQEFSDFDNDMQDAAKAMLPSAEKLGQMQWKDALQWEQKALQALLRAEATFRKIEVAFGQRGSAGAGAGNAGRDLASLFDLELDTEKNQYETAQKASPAEQREKDVEDALKKLDALAKRQEDLANQRRNPQQSFQQRWEQEMLRREAEQLQRQIEQMARGEQSAKGSDQGSQQQGTSAASGSQAGKSGDPRTEQALERLRQATDAMKRADRSQQDAGAAGQEAADQLRQASNLLAGTQRQLASNKVDSLAREASRLTQQERAQAQQIGKFVTQQRDASPTDLDRMKMRVQERVRLAQERQKLSDDLSRLQRGIRDTAREMAHTQPEVARKLRDALTEMDEFDLDNHVQRTADWLRRGIDPNSNGTETEIAQGLEKLNQQLQDAQKEVGQGKPGQPGSNQPNATVALDQLQRLRSQLEAMAGSRGSSTSGQNSRQQNGGSNQQDGKQGRTGQLTGDSLRRNDDSGDLSGDIRYGGAVNGPRWGHINTGNNRYGRPGERPAPVEPSNLDDSERTFQQGMRDLNELRHMVQNDPQAAQEVAALVRRMQQLDPSRFPGNPAMVERMQRGLLSSVDKLELVLRREVSSSGARAGKASAVPTEYQESVADYYRRLSKNP
ncbi:MAG: hypothetical protein DMG38_04115 [Acidobacteria bacterium]|nr:MAG: hypothetical protein DMG38_04115 [Acidobacteriota bacterium]